MLTHEAQPKLQLLLNDKLPKHQGVPKEYNLDITDPMVNNTYVFSEQDLPGYAAKNKAKADAIKSGVPAYLLRSKNEKEASATSWERRKKGGIQPRKSIPKKTAIAGRIRHELAGVALNNIETETIVRREREEAMKPKAETDIVNVRSINPERILQAGTQGAHDAFDGFIVSLCIPFLLPHTSLTIEPNRKRLPKWKRPSGWRTRRRGWPRTSCSTRSTAASASTRTGP
jgi:transcription initiation factor TFIIF subunit beta